MKKSYNSAITTCSYSKQWELALGLWKTMEQEGKVLPDVIFFNLLPLRSKSGLQKFRAPCGKDSLPKKTNHNWQFSIFSFADLTCTAKFFFCRQTGGSRKCNFKRPAVLFLIFLRERDITLPMIRNETTSNQQLLNTQNRRKKFKSRGFFQI